MFIVGDRKISENSPPLVIADIGINHGGSIDRAIEIADAAIECGVEIIKHQTHIPEDEMISKAKQVVPGNSSKSIYEIIDQCSLNEKEEIQLQQHILNKGAIFISTPFSRAAADRLQYMNIPAFKIGSGECNNLPLLKHIAKFGKPVILSTGMNDINSVRRSVKLLQDFNIPLAILHTTNLYPTPPNMVRLGAIDQLKNEFKNIPIGLSDHTVDNFASLAAVALGAKIIERHFVDNKSQEGPDIPNSMDPSECVDLLRGINIIHSELGGNKNDLLEEEQVTRDFAFSAIVSIKDINKGQVLSLENIWVKRPGIGGIPAAEFDRYLGKVARKNIPSDVQIQDSDLFS